MPAPLDLAIKKGFILDGTCAEERIADIGTRNGKIVAIGNLADIKGERLIDALGLKVTPGFIDLHFSHRYRIVRRYRRRSLALWIAELLPKVKPQTS